MGFIFSNILRQALSGGKSKKEEISYRLLNPGVKPKSLHSVSETSTSLTFKRIVLIYLEVYFLGIFLIQGVPPPADPPKPIFQLIPDRMVLHPGESQNVQLEGYSET